MIRGIQSVSSRRQLAHTLTASAARRRPRRGIVNIMAFLHSDGGHPNQTRVGSQRGVPAVAPGAALVVEKLRHSRAAQQRNQQSQAAQA